MASGGAGALIAALLCAVALPSAAHAANGCITGKVTNPSAVGIQTVRVSAYLPNGSYAGNAYTNVNGDYSLGGLVTGDYRLHFDDYNGVYAPEYYNDKQELDSADNVAVINGQTHAGINATLATGGRITGTVTDESSVGLGSVHAYAYRADGSGNWDYVWGVSTNSSGSYDLGGLASGTYRIYFHDSSGACLGEYYDDAPTLTAADDIAVTVGETHADIDAVLADAGHITGKVTNESAVGLGSVLVTIYRHNGSDWEWAGAVSTASTGTYDLAGLTSGTYRVSFSDGSGAHLGEYYNDKATLSAADNIAVTAGQTHADVDAILADAGHITGKVTDESAVGLENVRVSAYRLNGYGSWAYAGDVSTSSNGTYSLDGLASGAYRVCFSQYSGAHLTEYYNDKATLGTADNIAVTAGQTHADVDAALSVAGHITGRVAGAGAAGLQSVSVTAYRPNGTSVSSDSTDANGDYSIGNLTTGNYRLHFQDYSGAYLDEYYNDKPDLGSADAVAVVTGQTSPGIDATLAAAGRITGEVLGSSATGLDNIEIFAYRRNGSDWANAGMTFTSADGTYSLGGLATGTYRLQFHDYSGEHVNEYYDDKATLSAATNISVTAGATHDNVNATLLKRGHITGRVTNASDDGLGNVQVTAYQYGGGYWDKVREVSTDADGDYDIGGLATGGYCLRFEDPSGTCLPECYNDKPTLDLADDIAVTVGQTQANINASLAAAGHITGTVTDLAAGGIEGVDVTVYRADGYGDWDYVDDVPTDTHGNYDLGGLATGDYRLRFEDPSGTCLPECYDNAPTLDLAEDVTVTGGQTHANVNATLAAAGHITGAVTDTAANGLDDIGVAAYRADGIGGWDEVARASTNASGNYDLGGLTTGDYRVCFDGGSGAYVPECYDDEPTLDLAADVDVTAGQTHANVDATLVALGRITGRVTNAADEGLEDAEVIAYRSDGSGDWDYVNGVSTDAGGNYDLGRLATGDYRVRFADSSGAYLPECFDDEPTLDLAADVAVTAGQTHAGVNAELAVAGHITGRVTDAAGGLESIGVAAYRSDGSGGWDVVTSVSTNASGDYDLDGLATGAYRVRFEDYSSVRLTQYFDNQPSLAMATDVAVTAGQTHANVNATLTTGGHITGKVTDAAANGLEDIAVTAYCSDGSGGWEETAGASTNADGDYDLHGLTTGDYRIRFSGDGYAGECYNDKLTLDLADDVDVTVGETHANVNAALAASGRITGRVTDASAAGIPHVYVTAYRPDGSGDWELVNDVFADTNGNYDLGGLTTGAYRIRFEVSSGAYASEYFDDQQSLAAAVDVDVTAGQTHANVNAILAAAGHITGKVTNTAAHGVDEVVVTAYRSDGSGGWDTVNEAYTNANGNYNLGGLAAGNYRVRFQDFRGVYALECYDDQPTLAAGVDVDVTAGQTHANVNATLAAAGHITGKVTNAAASGLGEIDVTAYSPDGSGGWEEIGYAYTSPSGNYDIGGLTTGDYRLGFTDYSNTYLAEYYDGKPTLDLADPVTVTVGQTHPSINVALVRLQVPTSTCTCTCAFSTSAASGWQTADQTATFTAGGGSGSALTIHFSTNGGATWAAFADSVAVPITSEGAHRVKYYASDDLATESVRTAGYVNIDKTPPSTTDNHTAVALVAPATITLAPADALSGMSGGAAKTEYAVDGGAYATGTTVALGVGSHSVIYRSTDNAGNVESPKSFAVSVGPATALSSATAYGLAADPTSAWHNVDQTVTIIATGGAAPRTIHYSTDGGTSWSATPGDSAAVSVSTEGPHHLLFYASDATFTEPTHDAGYVNLDKTKPTTKAAAATVTAGKVVTLKYRITDAKPGCGKATVKIQIMKAGKVVKVISAGREATNAALTGKYKAKLKRGVYSWRVLATDVAGNKATKLTAAKLTVK